MIFPLKANGNVKTAVESMLSTGRIPHAILIEGDAGTGRHTLARFLATAAVCESDDRPCGSCRMCLSASSFNNPDIIFVSPEENKKSITVDKARTIRTEAYIKPHAANKKVYILDFAERMTEPVQNALLKILEEPPEAVIFIIIATSRTELLPTILSRCVCLSLTPPDFETAKTAVKEILGDIDEIKISEAVIAAENNIGAALTLLGSKGENKAKTAAEEFIKILFASNEYELLRLFIPFEKDRVGTDLFFEQLKIEISRNLKKDYGRIVRARALTTLYSAIDEWQKLLKTNINLPLLFSAVVCKSKQIIGGDL